MGRRTPLAFLLLLASCTTTEAAPDSGSEDAGVAVDAAVDAAPLDSGRRPPEDAGPPPEDLDGFVEWQMDAGGLAGIAAAVLRDGEVVWEGFYGFQSVEDEIPVGPHTLFAVGSISKAVASVPFMRLVEDGVIALEDPIEDHLGFSVRHPDHPDVPLTVHQLVTHTSGLEDNWPALGQVTVEGDPEISLLDFASAYVGSGGEYNTASSWGARPGTDWSYCNAGFGVMGAVAEAAAEVDLRTQTEQTLFDPLGMVDSGWFLADVNEADLAVPYTWNRARRSFVAVEQTNFAHYPAGTLKTSLHDMELFLRAFAGFGELDGTRILEAETVDAMFTLQFPELSNRQGLVWRRSTVAGVPFIGHSGATFGGSAQMLLERDVAEGEPQLGVLLFSNSDAYVLGQLGFDDGSNAMNAILARLVEDAPTL